MICATDKSQSSGVMAEQEWLNSLEPHVKDDQEASIEEVDQAEKRMMGTSFQLARALRMGVGHGQEEKVMQNLRSESVAIPNMTAKIKDHKELVEGQPVKVRPVCGAVEAPCGQLSNTLSEVINALAQFEDKNQTECKSSEELRAEIKRVNFQQKQERRAAQRLENEGEMGGEGRSSPNTTSEGGTEVSANAQTPAWRLENQMVVGSTDFKSYYPKLPVQRAAKMVNEMIQDSVVKIMTDDRELGLFLASTMTREEVVAQGLGEVVQERLHSAGAAPGITSREILHRGPTCPSKWKEQARMPTEEERRKMLGLMVETSINLCMEHHYYIYDGKVKKQNGGAGIGLRLSEALGRAFGLWWDGKLLEKLERLDWKPKMLKRYVDDVNTVVHGVKAGTKYNETEEKLEIVQDKVEDDQGKELDEITMRVFGEVANAVDPNIEVEIDFPSKNADRMMPILDMKMSMNQQNEVVYMFYRKPQCNKFTMMERSALPERVKRSTMINEETSLLQP